MKNFKVFLFVLLASLVFLGSANAEEKNYCPVYEHGVYVVTADKVNGTYVIVGKCPYCGHHSLKNLYECEQ